AAEPESAGAAGAGEMVKVTAVRDKLEQFVVLFTASAKYVTFPVELKVGDATTVPPVAWVYQITGTEEVITEFALSV
ncbi:hypothetical protein WG906_19335, partial [Pedobacter sp. P351]